MEILRLLLLLLLLKFSFREQKKILIRKYAEGINIKTKQAENIKFHFGPNLFRNKKKKFRRVSYHFIIFFDNSRGEKIIRMLANKNMVNLEFELIKP